MKEHPFKLFRDRHGLSQAELGTALGFKKEVAQGRVSHYERGRRGVSVEVATAFIELAAEYGEECSLESIFAVIESAA